jgi:hypothetical protein
MIATIAALASTLVGPITGLLSEVVTDKDKRDELAHKLSTMAATQAHENAMAQLEVNKTEAAHQNLFVAGWRPFVGWTCGTAMAFNYLIVPVADGFGFTMNVLDITTMFPVLMGMLGFAGLRSYEKVKGVSREK